MWDSIRSWAQSLPDAGTTNFENSPTRRPCHGGDDNDVRIYNFKVSPALLNLVHDHEEPLLDIDPASSVWPGDFLTRAQFCQKRQRSHSTLTFNHDHDSFLSGISDITPSEPILGALPRPIISMSSKITTPSPKKRKSSNLTSVDRARNNEGDDQYDEYDYDDETPRPMRKPQSSRHAASSSTRSSPTKSSDSVSVRSSSSARLRFVRLPLADEGIVKRQFSGRPSDPKHPKPIQDMLSKIQSLERCRAVLSSNCRASSSIASLLQEFDLDDTAFAPPDQPASSLTAAETHEIAEAARRCFEMDHDEPVWNAEVHQLLLTKVLRRDAATNTAARLCDFSMCTTASIIKEYLPEDAPDKRVDFCLYVVPAADASADLMSKVNVFRRKTCMSSLNHSSYGALCSYPISASLETKRSGNDLDGAVLQIGVWQAAQWKMLRLLLRETALARLSTRQGPSNPTQHDIENDVRAGLAELGAIHGVLIQGHDWLYVATSPEMLDSSPQNAFSSRTILWLSKRFGETTSDLGIHQTAAFLHLVSEWSTKTYWPWFKQWILAS